MATVKIGKCGKGKSALPATEREMARGFMYEFYHRYRFIAPGLKCAGGNEMDVIAIRRSGFVDEIEIKTTRGDFLADFKKTTIVHNQPGTGPTHERMDKHLAVAAGMALCNYFAFLMPPALAEQCESEIPEYAGLYTFTPNLFYGKIETVKRARMLHRGKIPTPEENRYLRAVSWRYVSMLIDIKTEGKE
jgi:hypothetical protein